MIHFLFTNFYVTLQNYKDHSQDQTILNLIKHLINFNVDQLLHLRKSSSSRKEKFKFKEEIKEDIKSRKGKFLSNVLDSNDEEIESDDDSDHEVGEFYNDYLDKKKRKRKNTNKFSEGMCTKDKNQKTFDFSSSSDEEEYESDEDLINEIINQNENSDYSQDDKDDDFLKVKSKKNEISKYITLYAPQNLINYFNSVNEFKLFDDVLNLISNKSIDLYIMIISSLSKNKTQALESIRKYKKILPESGKEAPKFRKVVKIKRK
jgi:hypothetical protein